MRLEHFERVKQIKASNLLHVSNGKEPLFARVSHFLDQSAALFLKFSSIFGYIKNCVMDLFTFDSVTKLKFSSLS